MPRREKRITKGIRKGPIARSRCRSRAARYASPSIHPKSGERARKRAVRHRMQRAGSRVKVRELHGESRGEGDRGRARNPLSDERDDREGLRRDVEKNGEPAEEMAIGNWRCSFCLCLEHHILKSGCMICCVETGGLSNTFDRIRPPLARPLARAA